MLDRLESNGGDVEIIALPHRIAEQMDIAQVRQEPRLGLVVGVADLVSNLHALTGQLATTSHDAAPLGYLLIARHRRLEGLRPFHRGLL